MHVFEFLEGRDRGKGRGRVGLGRVRVGWVGGRVRVGVL